MTKYESKGEKKIPVNDPSGKWTDVTLLPEWEEEFYDVFTARKYGKWVMFKALKPNLRDNPKYRKLMEREFETRYNLAHPNIVMVNDYELIPDIGMAMIFDDAYGYSLRRLIDEHRLTPRIVHRLETQLLDALDYIQEHHIVHYPISPENIIFTEYNENLKLINVGYDQREELSQQDTADDIEAYGRLLSEVLDNLPTTLPHLRRVARIAAAADPIRRYRSISDMRLAIRSRSKTPLFIGIAIFIAAMTAMLCYFAWHPYA